MLATKKTICKKNIGEQIADLLQRQPQNYDVIFSVGPEKKPVKAVKIVLKAASPVFEREFDDNWENAVFKDENDGIPLPDIDATGFELLVSLIISDSWAVDHLKSLPFNILISLLGLCRRYTISKGIENLEEAAEGFMESFSNYKDTPEFLEMSRENLETIFACQDIPLEEIEIFDCACRWAEHQCKQKNIEPTGENLRDELGSCLFEIRFPTMKFHDFTEVSRFKKNLFSSDEKVEIYDFIGMNQVEKTKYDTTQLLPFKTNPRLKLGSFGCSVLRLAKQFKMNGIHPTTVRSGVSYGSIGFQVNRKIALHGIGFSGLVNGDSHFDVIVKIKRFIAAEVTFEIEMSRKNILVPKRKVYHFLFDQPIIMEPNTYAGSWRNKYCIDYALMGPVGMSQNKTESLTDGKVEMSGVEFNIGGCWTEGKLLPELLFIKV